MFKEIDSNKKSAQIEEEILEFWDKENIFQKSVDQRFGKPLFSFYDGPPFATGAPHYGHILQSITKDVVPRYKSMQGFYVPRKWGWDCHGLPIENIVEKELGYTHKKEILDLGIDKFNDICRSKVLEYATVWEKVIRRMGRWADMKNAYKTMDLSFMESVWWVFRQLWNKGLVYESYRSMHICPRCETTLSQSEVAEGYKNVKDLSLTAKFELKDEPGTYILAWTTTPWTLIGNVALAVGKNIDYVKIKLENADDNYILAKSRLNIIKEKYAIIEQIKGSELAGRAYKPLFDYYQKNNDLENVQNGWKIYIAPFVTTEDGTGIVHIAPAFGEDDMELGKEYNLPFVQHVNLDGTIKKEVAEFTGLQVKPIDDVQKTDVEILKYLAKKDLLFSKEQYEHSYPHCWRCDTPLLNYATSSWFIKVTAVKQEAINLAKDINWTPNHIKEGRFGNWLEGARDWSISRQRFWASCMPIWVCKNCKAKKVLGSVKELEELSGQKITDLHKDKIDPITFRCDCGGEMRRVSDVLDTWFDSGSMPYAQIHYPFENEEKFKNSFPADFIGEAQDQTRAWFYYLHILSTALKNDIAFKNVVVSGIILAEDGKKMSKKLNNYPDPMLMFDKYGADAVRMYILTSPVMQAENLNFVEKDLASLSQGMFRMLLNSYGFFAMYANSENWQVNEVKTNNLLDKWILSELNILIKNINILMEKNELMKAARLFPEFINNLSNWYLRRSRKRFKSEDQKDKNEAFSTLYKVLTETAKLLAPFAPFVSEEIYKNLTQKESVHLADYPEHNENEIDENITKNMKEVRILVEDGLAKRAEKAIRIRQPLAAATIKTDLESEYLEIIKDELNVKNILVNKNLDKTLEIDTHINEELLEEGNYRDLLREVQDLRKKAGLKPGEKIKLFYNPNYQFSKIIIKFETELKQETAISDIEDSLQNEKLWLGER
jgi:isoleucyl-tRNA synthetase